jgi:hypothetical protein
MVMNTLEALSSGTVVTMGGKETSITLCFN